MADTKLRNLPFDLAFEQEWLAEEFVTQLESHMERQGMTRKKLAEKMGRSPAFITKSLRQGTNLTVHTMVHMAQAAGLRICLSLAPLSQLKLPQSMHWSSWTVMYCDQVSANDQQWGRMAGEPTCSVVTTSDPDVALEPSWCEPLAA